MKRLWINICIWFHQRGYKRMVRKEINKPPRAYEKQGWEFEEWGRE